MKTLFSNKRTMSLIRGGITLLIVSIMVSIFTISPLGTTATQAQFSRPRLRLGKTKTAFGGFCYSYWTGGHRSDALTCLRQSKKAMQLLQQEMSPDSFTKWPQQLSLSDLAAQNLLLARTRIHGLDQREDVGGPGKPEPADAKHDRLVALGKLK